MTYMQFHIVFTFPIVAIAIIWYSISLRIKAPSYGKFATLIRWPAIALLAHVVMALLYTTPWDNYLVANGVWEESQNNIVSIGSADMCAFGGVQISGYVAGNPVVVRVYRPSEGLEYATNLTFGMGTGVFGDVLQSITEVTLTDVIGGGGTDGGGDGDLVGDEPNSLWLEDNGDGNDGGDDAGGDDAGDGEENDFSKMMQNMMNPEMMQQMMNSMGGTNALNQNNPNSREGKMRSKLQKKVNENK